MAKSAVTPAGIAKYAWLSKPDTKFDPDGVYKVNLILDPADPEVQEFLEGINNQLNDYHASELNKPKAKKLAKALPYKDDFNEDGDSTGMVSVALKTKAVVKDKETGLTKPKTLPIINKYGKPIPEGTSVGNGSTIKAAYSSFCTTVKGVCYLSLYLNAVQVLDLVEYSGNYGFTFEEEPEGQSKPRPVDDDDILF